MKSLVYDSPGSEWQTSLCDTKTGLSWPRSCVRLAHWLHIENFSCRNKFDCKVSGSANSMCVSSNKDSTQTYAEAIKKLSRAHSGWMLPTSTLAQPWPVPCQEHSVIHVPKRSAIITWSHKIVKTLQHVCQHQQLAPESVELQTVQPTPFQNQVQCKSMAVLGSREGHLRREFLT